MEMQSVEKIHYEEGIKELKDLEKTKLQEMGMFEVLTLMLLRKWMMSRLFDIVANV